MYVYECENMLTPDRFIHHPMVRESLTKLQGLEYLKSRKKGEKHEAVPTWPSTWNAMRRQVC